jgi:RNA polymerase sigma factor (sigma-70 family)
MLVAAVQGGEADMHDGREGENHGEWIESKLLLLLVIARAIIRDICSNPEDHKRDVVQQAIVKFLQAESNRGSPYDTPVRILLMAVKQEAIRHCETYSKSKEVVVDFNESPDQLKESDSVNQASYSPRELAQAISSDPREMYVEWLDLKKSLTGVTDQDLFLLYYFEGRTLEEIAILRGWPIMKVQRRVKKLRKELGIYDDEGPSDN